MKEKVFKSDYSANVIKIYLLVTLFTMEENKLWCFALANFYHKVRQGACP
jgi:hypothetical protein